MKGQTYLRVIVLALTLSGCSSMEKSILLGSSIGFGTGVGLGSTLNADNGRMSGGAIGALLGGVIAWDIYKTKETKDKNKVIEPAVPKLEFASSASGAGPMPKLKPAQVKVKLVEGQIKDGTFVPAHFEYEIAEPARWEGGK